MAQDLSSSLFWLQIIQKQKKTLHAKLLVSKKKNYFEAGGVSNADTIFFNSMILK
jgi:hypothetical protein